MEIQHAIMDFEFDVDKVQETHFHQNIEIIYVLEGKLEVQLEMEAYKLSKGDFILVNSNRRHSLRELEGDLLSARFRINYEALTELLKIDKLLFWCNSAYDKNSAYVQLKGVLDKILYRYYDKQNEGILQLNSLYYTVLYTLVTHFMISSDDKRIKDQLSLDNARIFEVQTYVDENYRNQIKLTDLAKQLYLSNAYLSKYIKKQFGISFKDYVNKVRLFHALDDLLHSNKRITQIAMDNGFPTSAAFNKAFRAAYQITPSVYRAEMQNSARDVSEESPENQAILERIESYLDDKVQKSVPVKEERMQLFEVSARDAAGYQKSWSKIINMGNLESMLNSIVQEQLLLMKEELGFSYVRIWNIFTEDMYTEGKYNFSRIDRVLDFLVKHKLKPYIELAFKPINIIYSINLPLVEKENTIVFQDSLSYEKVMNDLARHLLNRYGAEELQSWYFELWKDDRLNMQDEDGRYFECFEIGYQALKAVEKNVKVGGAGFAMGYDRYRYRELLQNWKKRNIYPDFISVYAYSYELIKQNNMYYGKRSLDSSFLKNQVEIFRKILKEEAFEQTEFHVTEWNFTVSNRNCINDSPAQAAYIMKNCIESLGVIDMLGYWHGSDICTEYYDSEGILYGGNGLLSRDSIKKPSYYAFYFLNFMHSKLLGRTDNALLTASGKGEYAIACHNNKQLTFRYSLKEEKDITITDLEDMYEERQEINLQFSINDVKNGDYLMRTFLVNEENGSVQNTWKDMEYMKNLSGEEIHYLRQSAMPRIELHRISVKDETLNITTRLMPHEIKIIDIRYQH